MIDKNIKKIQLRNLPTLKEAKNRSDVFFPPKAQFAKSKFLRSFLIKKKKKI